MTRRRLLVRGGLLGAILLAGLTACVPKFETGAVLTIALTGSGGALSWPAAIELDQGQTLASYRIDVDGTEVARIAAPNQACTLTGLTAGPHVIEVTAYDSANEWSGTLANDGRLTGSLTPPAPAPTGTPVVCDSGPQAPGTPTNVTAQPIGEGKASVTWTPPAYVGSAPIEAYLITPYREGVAEDGFPVGADLTTATLTTLTNGYDYTFTVRALNNVGRGPESSPSGSVFVVGSFLRVGQKLLPGHSIYSPSGQYRLAMQEDGNLVLYADGRVIWATYTQSMPGSYLFLQDDGNLVLYPGGGGPALWDAGTVGRQNPHLTLQSDANLVLYSTNAGPWSLGSYNDRLHPGQTLRPNWYLENGGRTAHLTMQGDGNFVLYKNGPAVWSTGTLGQSGATATMQGDGNLVVYNNAGAAVWNSGTAGRSGAIAVLQSDGNLQIIWNGQAIWSSNTGNPQSSAVDNFVNRWNGRCADYDGAYGAQCVDLYNFYNRDVVGAARYTVSYAYQLWSNYDTSKYTKVSSGASPRKGDVAIWSSAVGGGAGHVAIVLEDVNGSTIRVVDQNWPVGSCTSVGNRPKANLLGYLRPNNI